MRENLFSDFISPFHTSKNIHDSQIEEDLVFVVFFQKEKNKLYFISKEMFSITSKFCYFLELMKGKFGTISFIYEFL